MPTAYCGFAVRYEMFADLARLKVRLRFLYCGATMFTPPRPEHFDCSQRYIGRDGRRHLAGHDLVLEKGQDGLQAVVSDLRVMRARCLPLTVSPRL